MAKPDPVLFDPARYPFKSEIELRVSDLDLNRHVNNVALVEILQEGRSRFHRATDERTRIENQSLMVAKLSVDFIGQSHYGEPITCHCGIIRLGNTSQTIAQLAMQGGSAVAYGEVVMVSVVDGMLSPHPAAFRQATAQWMIAQ